MNNIVVYTKPNCPECVKAKGILNLRAIPFREIAIGSEITRDQLMEQFPGVKMAPVITIDGTFIGGFSKLVEWLDGSSGQELLLG